MNKETEQRIIEIIREQHSEVKYGTISLDILVKRGEILAIKTKIEKNYQLRNYNSYEHNQKNTG